MVSCLWGWFLVSTERRVAKVSSFFTDWWTQLVATGSNYFVLCECVWQWHQNNNHSSKVDFFAYLGCKIGALQWWNTHLGKFYDRDMTEEQWDISYHVGMYVNIMNNFGFYCKIMKLNFCLPCNLSTHHANVQFKRAPLT